MRRILVSAIVTLALAACGSVGRESSDKQWAASPATGAARPIAVAWTSARATKCGFSFDAATLRANHLAAEAKTGADPEALQKAQQAYDFTVARAGKALGAAANYCSKSRIENIRSDLNRHLAGDFAPGPRRASDEVEND